MPLAAAFPPLPPPHRLPLEIVDVRAVEAAAGAARAPVRILAWDVEAVVVAEAGCAQSAVVDPLWTRTPRALVVSPRVRFLPPSCDVLPPPPFPARGGVSFSVRFRVPAVGVLHEGRPLERVLIRDVGELGTSFDVGALPQRTSPRPPDFATAVPPGERIVHSRGVSSSAR